MSVPTSLTSNVRDLAEWIDTIKAKRTRKMVAVAGPPASGKSTLAEALVDHLNDTGRPAGLLPMDGFHLDNPILEGRGLRARKGAPETFDVPGLTSIVARLAAGENVYAPRFDRSLEVAIGSAIPLGEGTDIIVAEGNYLLLDHPDWHALQSHWDSTVMVDVPQETLRERLTERWAFYGLSAEEMRVKIDGNDMPNAERIRTRSRPADLVIRN